MADCVHESGSEACHCDQVGGNPYDEMANPACLIVGASITHPRGMKGITPVCIKMELDTGADMTMVPSDSVSDMHLPSSSIYVRDCKGNVGLMKEYEVQLKCPNLNFADNLLAVATDSPRGLVGRDILNSKVLILNGPAKCWCCPSELDNVILSRSKSK